jgi:hypothetical protein
MTRFNQPGQQFNGNQYNADHIDIHPPPRQRGVILVLLVIVFLAAAAVGGYAIFSSIGNNPQVPATATPSGPNYTVKNTSETPPDGVYFRHSMQLDPAQPTPTPTTGFGVFMNEQVRVACWTWGDAVYGDRVWYYAYNITRPNVAGRPNKGWIDAHYVDDGMTANHPAPGIPQCKSPLPIGG